MSPAEMLGQLIMFWFGRILRIAGVAIPLFGALHVMFIIFSDEFFSQHIILTLILTSLFSFACCLLTLAKICVLRRRPHAENTPIDLLCDSDLEYNNETEEVPHYKLSCHFKDIGNTLQNLSFKNPLEFCKFRPAYGMFLLTGFAFLFVFAATLTQVKQWNVKDDFYCVALELIVPMVMLISLTFFIANTGFYTAARDYDMYTPFEQFIHVPMKVVVGKTVAVFLTGGTHSCVMLFIFSLMALCMISSNNLYYATDIEGVLKNLLPPIFPDARKVLRTILIVMTVMCFHALIGMIVAAYFEAKKSILCIIEKNWQKNLVAISFLLPDTEAESLEDLKTALHHKRTQPLTEKEELAFNYISWPIWRSKQPFMLCKFETDEFLQSESSNRQPDEQDEAENSTQLDTTEPALVKPVHVDEAENSTQLDATEPALVKPVHVDEPSKAVVQEVIKPRPSEQLIKETMHKVLKFCDEPSTSAACLEEIEKLKELTKTFYDLSELERPYKGAKK